MKKLGVGGVENGLRQDVSESEKRLVRKTHQLTAPDPEQFSLYAFPTRRSPPRADPHSTVKTPPKHQPNSPCLYNTLECHQAHLAVFPPGPVTPRRAGGPLLTYP